MSLLWIPGPTEVNENVLRAMTKPMISHRGKDFTKLYEGIIGKIAEYFQTKQNVCTITASGTIWMEITGRSIVKKKALCGVCGAFSKRMLQTIRDCGKEAVAVEVDLGKSIRPEMIMNAMSKDNYDTVVVVHNETATGVRNPIAEIGKQLKKKYPDVLFVVDAVSSAGGDYLVPEELFTDVMFTSSQKCFALPPGLSIACYSDAAVRRAEEVPGRGYYTDLLAHHKFWIEKHQNPTTPNVSLLYALDYQLDRMLDEGPVKRFERHREMAQTTQAWANKHFAMFPEPESESITVSTIANNRDLNISILIEKLKGAGHEIANGYGVLRDKTFRIGHMGEHTPDKLKLLLQTINEVWMLE